MSGTKFTPNALKACRKYEYFKLASKKLKAKISFALAKTRPGQTYINTLILATLVNANIAHDRETNTECLPIIF